MVASATVTTGSAVETIEADAGPTSRSPTKNALTPRTVEPSAIAAIQPQPAAAKWRSSEPLPAPTTSVEAAAPVVTSAAIRKASRPPTTRSATRM